jgi:hypothetical protein
LRATAARSCAEVTPANGCVIDKTRLIPTHSKSTLPGVLGGWCTGAAADVPPLPSHERASVRLHRTARLPRLAGQLLAPRHRVRDPSGCRCGHGGAMLVAPSAQHVHRWHSGRGDLPV